MGAKDANHGVRFRPGRRPPPPNLPGMTTGYSSMATSGHFPSPYSPSIESVTSMIVEDSFDSHMASSRPVRGRYGSTLQRYLSDPQIHEMIALGIATFDAKTSPMEDIRDMKKKIQAIIPEDRTSLPVPKVNIQSASKSSRETSHCQSSGTFPPNSRLEEEPMQEAASSMAFNVKGAGFGQDSGYISNNVSRVPPEISSADENGQESWHPAHRGNAEYFPAVASSPLPRLAEDCASNDIIKDSSATNSVSPLEEEFDSDSDENLNCFIPPPSVIFAPLQIYPTFRQSLTPVQIQKAEHLRECLRLKLAIDWQSICQNKRCPLPGSDPISKTDSGIPSEGTAKKRSTKRTREKNADESSDDDAGEDFRGSGGSPPVNDLDRRILLFACPYRKQNPRKYCVREWGPCALTGHQTISRVKGHLYRYHLIHQCERCKGLFDSDEELRNHFLGVEVGALRDCPPVDGITSWMKGQLQSRKKPFRGQTPAQAWGQIFCFLFPGQEAPDPYFEPVQNRQEESTRPHENDDLTRYQDFISRELPRFFQEEFDNAIFNNNNILVDEHIRTQMMSLLPGTLSRAFSAFRTSLDQNVTAPTQDEPQFLSSLPISEQRTACDTPSIVSSDSGYASQRNHSTVLYGTGESDEHSINDLPREIPVVDESIINETSQATVEPSEPISESLTETTGPMVSGLEHHNLSLDPDGFLL